ncbi:hypothetical protein M8J75_012650 [Diaphorina citri]|nr:hypothetical protein M8J75_012650 [Diaphorina citri]
MSEDNSPRQFITFRRGQTSSLPNNEPNRFSPPPSASLNATLLSPRLVMTSNATTTSVTTTVTTPIPSTGSAYLQSPLPFRTYQQRAQDRIQSTSAAFNNYFNSTAQPGLAYNDVPPVNSFVRCPAPGPSVSMSIPLPRRNSYISSSTFNHVNFNTAPASTQWEEPAPFRNQLFQNDNPAPASRNQDYFLSAPPARSSSFPAPPSEHEFNRGRDPSPAPCYSPPPPPSPPHPLDFEPKPSTSTAPIDTSAIPGTSKQTFFRSNTVSFPAEVHAISPRTETLCDSPMPLIRIPASLHGVKLDVIVDSGASGNFVRSDRVDALPVEPVDFQALLADNKGALAITGKLSLDIEIKGHSYRLIFYSCPELSHDAILGQPFLNQVQAIMDYTRRCITLGTASRNQVYWQEPAFRDEDYQVPPGVVDHIPDPVKTDLLNLFHRHRSVFNDRVLGHTGLIVHKIQLTDPRPFKQYPYKYSPQKRQIIKTIVRELEALDVIERSTSPYNSPIVVTEYPPESGKDPRLCIDFRRLNEITVEEPCLKTNIHTLIHEVQGASIFTTLDLKCE